MSEPLLNIVLLHPQIPNNTGNVGRTAAVTGCRLHIVHPIAFDMSEKARRRAGLDYWHLVDCREHASWDAYLERERPTRAWLYTTGSTRAQSILEQWAEMRQRFIKVFPKEYRRALTELAAQGSKVAA